MRIGIGLAITGRGAVAARAITSPSLAYSAGNITVTASTNFDLTGGRFGAAVSVNGAAAVWYDGAGAAAGAQSLVLSLTAIGAVAGDQIDVDPGYSLTDPAVDKVYCSDSGIYPAAVIDTPTITGGSNPPVSGETLTGVNGTMVGPFGQVRSVLWLQSGSAEGDTDNSLLLDAGNVGGTIAFRNVSTFGAAVVTATSAATGAVVPNVTFQTITQRQAMVFNGGGSQSGTIVLPSAIASGKLLVGHGYVNYNKTPTVSDDTGDGVPWNVSAGVDLGTGSAKVFYFWKQAGTTNGTGKTITIDGGAGNTSWAGSVGEWQATGTNPVFSLDGTPLTPAQQNGTNPNFGNITLASSSGLLLSLIFGDGGTNTAGSGFTRDFTNGSFVYRGAGEWKIVTAGTYATDWVNGSAQTYAGAGLGFKALA